jgi:hypothetical protein
MNLNADNNDGAKTRRGETRISRIHTENWNARGCGGEKKQNNQEAKERRETGRGGQA